MTLAAEGRKPSRIPPERQIGGELYGQRRAQLLGLFGHFLSINRHHVALCLGISEQHAAVMLSTLQAEGRAEAHDYRARRGDPVRVFYTLRGVRS